MTSWRVQILEATADGYRTSKTRYAFTLAGYVLDAIFHNGYNFSRLALICATTEDVPPVERNFMVIAAGEEVPANHVYIRPINVSGVRMYLFVETALDQASHV